MNFLRSKPIYILRDRKENSKIYVEPRKSNTLYSNTQTSGWSKVTNKLEDNFLTRMIKKISSGYNDKRKAQYNTGIKNPIFDKIETSSLCHVSKEHNSSIQIDSPYATFPSSFTSYSPSPLSSPIGIKIKKEKVFSNEAIDLFKSNSFDDILEFGYRWPNEQNEDLIKTVRVSLTPPSLSLDYSRDSFAFPYDY